MASSPSNDPLHGKTLQSILEELVERLGWEAMGGHIRINCFLDNPSINSSLKFLRKTPWARKKVEELYLRMIA
ncbi:MAG: DUF2132 domain-containing protein [Chitinophagaceae bacterium]|nr:DUF2132 domain-containing protein [Chitinophagaceae bacterium]MBL0055980.1 DUF2132 domain-containing protein [Chitinophagaceae bacterium]